MRYLLHELAPFQGGCIWYARPGGAAVIKSAIVNLNKATRPLRHCIQAQKQRIYFICVSFRTIAIVCSTLMWLIAVSDSSLISTINYNTPHCYFHWAYIFPPLLGAHIKYTPLEKVRIASNIKNIFIQLNRILYYYYRMIGEHFPKVSPPSRQSLKSYNAKFVMDKCARNKYGATLKYSRFN